MRDAPENGIPCPTDYPGLYDLAAFNARLLAAVARINEIRPYQIESLGQVGGHDIYLVTPAERLAGKPDILTAGGFHGNEPAGPWGILEFLEMADEETLLSVNHSFVPLVNPTGFEKAQRYNIYGENPNRGFVPELLTSEEEIDADWTNRGPSAEGKILMARANRLVSLAKNGFTSQHEDDGLTEGFIFINENAEMPSKTATAYLDTIQRHFPLIPDGGKNELIGAPIKDGMWVNGADSSCEWFMFQQGVPCTVTTETGSLSPARARVDCNRDFVKTFADVSAGIYAQQKPRPVARPPAPPRP